MGSTGGTIQKRGGAGMGAGVGGRGGGQDTINT